MELVQENVQHCGKSINTNNFTDESRYCESRDDKQTGKQLVMLAVHKLETNVY